MIEKVNANVFELIRATIWNEKATDHIANWAEYEELKKHAIIALPAPILSELIMPLDLRDEWKKSIIRQIIYYTQYKYEQNNLPITVPYVVLKGMAAAKYYTHPEFRTMGDIDILTKREDYQIACSMLIENGYIETTSEIDAELGRHRTFIKNGIVIEVHAFFALLRDSHKEKILDDILFQNINESHYLPDVPNGLVLLDHINQHIAGGLGLRHIIDWMMFTDKCLPDEKWPDFKILVRKVGLETLAVTVTEMCVMFLGLPKREWCANANKALCQELMEYILSCGNFGNKDKDEASIGAGVFGYARSFLTSIRLLHKRGMINWRAARRHVWLRPFAGIYQFFRYLHRGLDRDEAVIKLKNEFYAARKKNTLLDKLEVRRVSD